MNSCNREDEMVRKYLPCNCIGNDHGLLLTLDKEDDDVYISMMQGMFSGRNTLSERIRMAWMILRGTLFEDFVIVQYDVLRKAVKDLKHGE